MDSRPDAQKLSLDVTTLWSALQDLLIPIWPKTRTHINGVPIGDAWPLSTLSRKKIPSDPITPGIQPFHKLTQWLAYSILVPFEQLLGVTWENKNLLTGLPEYRNGGLFVDMRVLTLKPDVLSRGLKVSAQSLPQFDASDDVIVEWRAMTVALLSEMHQAVNKKLAEATDGKADALSLAQILEAGTWKAGRELAAKFRPETRSSPILVVSDGTLF